MRANARLVTGEPYTPRGTLASGEPARERILTALLELPLGARMMDVSRHARLHVRTVTHHVHRLRETGRVLVLRNGGFGTPRLILPARAPLSEEERRWLCLGVLTARAILVVAQAGGRRVSSAMVARRLGWNVDVTRYHLQRAKRAGILHARHGQGYALANRESLEARALDLHERSFLAIEYVASRRRRVSWPEVARALAWTTRSTKYHLTRAVEAGLLEVRQSSGYALTPMGERARRDGTLDRWRSIVTGASA